MPRLQEFGFAQQSLMNRQSGGEGLENSSRERVLAENMSIMAVCMKTICLPHAHLKDYSKSTCLSLSVRIRSQSFALLTFSAFYFIVLAEILGLILQGQTKVTF